MNMLQWLSFQFTGSKQHEWRARTRSPETFFCCFMHLVSFFSRLWHNFLHSELTDLLTSMISFLYAHSFHYSFMLLFFILFFPLLSICFLPLSYFSSWQGYESNVMKSQANRCLNVHSVWCHISDKLFPKVSKYFGSWNCELTGNLVL